MTRPAAEPHGVARVPGGKIRIPFSLAQDGVTADGMREIGPDDPRYAGYDEWLAALDAAAADTGDTWTVTGDIPDSGEHVTLTWRDGIDGWPADALDWALAAATEGLVQLDDGPRLLAWLQTQGFTETSQAQAAAQWEEARHPRVPGGKHGGEFTRKPGGSTRKTTGELDYSALLDRDFPYDQIRTGGQDQALQALAKLRGFDGPAHVIPDTDLDARVAAGEPELWRGFNGINGGSEEQTRGFATGSLTGPYRAGAGTWGNGTYVAHADTAAALAEIEQEYKDEPRDASGEFTESWVRKSYARDVARAKGKARAMAAGYASSHGTLTRMTLDKNAKTITWDELRAKWQKRNAELAASPPPGDRGRRETELLADPGRYAVILGYDAVTGGMPGEMLILNRTALHASSRLQPAEAP